MTRFTKCLTAVAVVTGMGLAAQTASAGPPAVVVHPTIPNGHLTPFPPKPFPNPGPFPPRPFPPKRIDFDYVVLYKPSIFSGSRVYGRYETMHAAEHAARRLEFRGYATRIERFRDHGRYGW